MNIGLYQSAASLTALERWQDAVAQNITSSQVPGFKKRTVEFKGMAMGDVVTSSSKNEGQTGVLPKATYGINFQGGETHPTRRDLDAAIQGDGFFQIQNGEGQRGFTRAGAFHLTADRSIVTADGSRVLSTDGNPITLSPDGGEIAISPDGTITQGENQVGRIGVFRFLDNSKLMPMGGGLFRAPEGVAALPSEKAQVLQGHLEASNVTPLREMVALVQIARAYEANQKLIASRDQILDRTLQTLG